MNENLDEEMKSRLMQTMKKSVLPPSTQQEICARNPDDIQLGHLHEQICAEAMVLAGQGRGPTDLMTVLLNMNLAMLCPMAAEIHHQATVTRAQDHTVAELATRSPVFAVRKIMFICPVGALDRLALQHIADRALRLATGKRIKTAFLFPAGLTADRTVIDEWCSLLTEELESQKITLQMLL